MRVSYKTKYVEDWFDALPLTTSVDRYIKIKIKFHPERKRFAKTIRTQIQLSDEDNYPSLVITNRIKNKVECEVRDYIASGGKRKPKQDNYQTMGVEI